MKHYLLLLALPLGTLACGPPEGGAGRDAAEAVDVTVSIPVEGSATVTFPATVISGRTAEIATRLSGRVASVAVDVGDEVRAGDVLVTLDAADIAARVRGAEAALELARRSHGRVERLAGAGAAAQAELDGAGAALDAASAVLDEARAQEAYALVRAPFAGVVARRSVEVGDLAVPGRPLLVLLGPDDLELEALLPAAWAGSVQVGDTARAWLPSADGSIRVLISRVSGALTPGARTFRVEAPLPAGTLGARPGEYARLALPGVGEAGRWIPADAVFTRGQLHGVFALEADTLRLRWVRLGRHSGDAVELLAGPVAPLVRRPPDRLRDGVPAGVVSEEPFTGPGGTPPARPAPDHGGLT